MTSDSEQFGYRIAATAFANFSAAAGATLAEMNQRYLVLQSHISRLGNFDLGN